MSDFRGSHQEEAEYVAELEKALAEAQRQRGIESAQAQQAEEAWLNRLRLAVTDRDSLRTQFKFAEQAWQAEREVLKRELAEAQQDGDGWARAANRFREERDEAQQALAKEIQIRKTYWVRRNVCLHLEKERDTLRGLLRDIWEDPASGALKDDIFHRLERITAALPKEGE